MEFLEEKLSWDDHVSDRIKDKKSFKVEGYDTNINWKINKETEEIY